MSYPKVFISSTCYDLIDLRAELESEFKLLGFMPLLSDSITSEFEVNGIENSIETCLRNVASCDYYVIILSQRYGPKLTKAGYENISATHLEYNKAIELNKPIYMYVRDRFEEEFRLFSKSSNDADLLKFVDRINCAEMFDLFSNHVKLTTNVNKANWYFRFKDSVELKEMIKARFTPISGKLNILSKILEQGSFPLIRIKNAVARKNISDNTIELLLDIENDGNITALNPALQIAGCAEEEKVDFISQSIHKDSTLVNSIGSKESVRYTIQTAASKKMMDSMNIYVLCEAVYVTIDRHTMADVSSLSFHWESIDPIKSATCYIKFLEKGYRSSGGYRISGN